MMLRQVETAPTTVVAESATKNEIKTTVAPFTAEEIAQAIAELEKERHVARAGQDETAQLNDILEQLQLDLPAAKVAEQVQKLRLVRLQKSVRRRRNIFAGSAATLVCLLATGLLWLHGHNAAAVIPAAPATVANDIIPASTITPEKLVVMDRSSGEAISKTLAEVPEGVRVSISGDELLTLLGVSKEYYGTILHPETHTWTVYRENGMCYLHAATTIRQTHAALLATPEIRLYNKNDAQVAQEEPAATVPVDLPINSIDRYTVNSQDATSDYQELELHLGNVDNVTFGK